MMILPKMHYNYEVIIVLLLTGSPYRWQFWQGSTTGYIWFHVYSSWSLGAVSAGNTEQTFAGNHRRRGEIWNVRTTRKSVIGVSDQADTNLAVQQRLEILDLERRGIVLSEKGKQRRLPRS